MSKFMTNLHDQSVCAAVVDSSICNETIMDVNLDLEAPSSRSKLLQSDVLSFVIPVKDEAKTLDELCQRIIQESPSRYDVEIIFIDDGSTDESWKVIKDLTQLQTASVRGIRFRRNAGKAAALTAGFRAAHGQIVFTMDADLQDDPTEIPRMLAKLEEGYDIVSGWKKVRHDPWHKVLPSRVFNWTLSRVCGVRLHDHNCGFKCYRSEVTSRLKLHGELHRMVPSVAAILGYRTTEIVVQHHARKEGKSKYGFERYLRGFMDMLTIGFLKRFRERPAHFFGGIAAGQLLLGAICLLGGFLIGATAPAGQILITLAGVLAIATGPIVGCAMLSELGIRGGLTARWELPIVSDTAFPQEKKIRSEKQPSARRISTTY